MERELTAHEKDRAERNRKDAAARFEPDGELEKALEWEANGDARFDALDPGTKIAAAYYKRDRADADDERAGKPLPDTTKEEF